MGKPKAPALLVLPWVKCVYWGMLMNWVSMLWIGLLAAIFAVLSVASLPLWAAPADLVLHLSFMTTAPAATAVMALLLCVLFSPLAMPWSYPRHLHRHRPLPRRLSQQAIRRRRAP